MLKISILDISLKKYSFKITAALSGGQKIKFDSVYLCFLQFQCIDISVTETPCTPRIILAQHSQQKFSFLSLAGESGDNDQSHWVKRSSLVDSRTSVTDVKFAPKHLGLQLVRDLFYLVITCERDILVFTSIECNDQFIFGTVIGPCMNSLVIVA